MKKIIIIILLAISSFSILSAEYLSEQIKNIPLEGYIDSFCALYVEPVYASSLEDTVGLPFPITVTENTVTSINNSIVYRQANLSDGNLVAGRPVASWTLATNSSVKTLTVKASPFIYDGNGTVINYYLCLMLEYLVGNGTTQTAFLTVNTATDQDGKTFTIDTAEPVISEENPILIMFNEYSDSDINMWPDGYYEATVTFSLTGT